MTRKTSGRLPLFCLTAAIFVLSMPVSAQTGDYRIGKGDQLLITVWGFPEFTTSATVREDGALALPLAGDIQAAGLTRDEFIGALRKRLADYIQGEIRVTVSVLSSSVQRVTILGAVSRPDSYPLSGETGLLEVMGLAGGPASDSDTRRIRIFRKDRPDENLLVDLDASLERADVDHLPLIRPGDVVFVPRERNFLKEFGEYMGYVAVFFALVRLTEGGGR